MAAQTLDVVEDDGTVAVLKPDTLPAVLGEAADGIDFCCPCGQVLGASLGERQVWDVAVACPSCGAISSWPHLPSGEAVGRAVFVDVGRYRLADAVRMPPSAVMLGPAALKQRMSETGHGIFTGERELVLSSRPGPLDPLDLRLWVAKVKELLGETFDDIETRHLNALASHTPPQRLHRLMVLVDAAETSARSAELGRPSVDAVAIAELQTAIAVLEAWRWHPMWPAIVRSLKHPPNFDHHLVALATASFLADAGNDVTLLAEDGRKRTPDLQVYVNATDRLVLEVKAPGEVRGPRSAPLDRSSARRVVTGALSKASTSPGGQLGPDAPGVLVVGAFHLTDGDIDLLGRAANTVASRRLVGRQHVAGIVVVCLRAVVEGDVRPAGTAAMTGPGGVTLWPAFTVRVAWNPAYTGDIRISEERNARLRPLGGP